MALKKINSHQQMLESLVEKKKNYVLLYKKGSEVSDCSYAGVDQAAADTPNINAMAADVTLVRDIHPIYHVTSAPALLVFEGKNYVKTVKGCNDEGFYKSLFGSSLFAAKSVDGETKQKRVIVYSTPSCSWCTTLKRHLDTNGINYREVDVSKDQKSAEQMVKKSGQQGVPQTDINGQMIVGFDKVKINSLLGINSN